MLMFRVVKIIGGEGLLAVIHLSSVRGVSVLMCSGVNVLGLFGWGNISAMLGWLVSQLNGGMC